MITILAWMVFIPAVVWNMVLFVIVFNDIVTVNKYKWLDARNMRDLALSLTILFVPGVYIFGWF